MIARKSPDLSVVIVNYYSEDELAMCLRSLENSQEPVEVIVVDNGSQKQAIEQLLEVYPSLIWQSMGGNAGFAAACNAGARRAQSDKLLFLNPDTEVFSDSLGNLARALDSRAYSGAIMGCGIENPDGTTQLSCRSFPNWKTFLAGRFSLLTRLFPSNSWSVNYLMSEFNHSDTRQVDWVSGAALGIRKSSYERLGGFDESYFVYFEDVDLCKRASGLGIPAIYYPEARIQHLIGGSSQTAALRALAYKTQKYVDLLQAPPWKVLV